MCREQGNSEGGTELTSSRPIDNDITHQISHVGRGKVVVLGYGECECRYVTWTL